MVTKTSKQEKSGVGIDYARRLAEDRMRQWGLGDWLLAFNRRKSQMGACYYPPKGSKIGRIELSIYMVTMNDHAEVEDTILHEIAHALAGKEAYHGPKWVAVCKKVGARPSSRGPKDSMPMGKHQANCPHCGMLLTRHKKPSDKLDYVCPRVECRRKPGGELKFVCV